VGSEDFAGDGNGVNPVTGEVVFSNSVEGWKEIEEGLGDDLVEGVSVGWKELEGWGEIDGDTEGSTEDDIVGRSDVVGKGVSTLVLGILLLMT